MDAFSLKIIAINKVFYEGDARQLIFSAADGLVGVLAHHENAVIAVNVGEVKVLTTDDQWVTAMSGAGHIQIDRNRVVMIVDTVEYPEEIDEQRALEAKERAEEELRQDQSIYEYTISKACLLRAIERLKMKNKYSSR